MLIKMIKKQEVEREWNAKRDSKLYSLHHPHARVGAEISFFVFI
jgi:hypothetical protein